MTYDAERYQVRQQMFPIRATFASALLGTTATNTNSLTSAVMSDRVEFFRKIKLTSFGALPEVAPDANSHATSMTCYCELCLGTVVYARASVGTVAGVMADGTIVVSTLASATACNLRYSVTGWDGTVQTMDLGAVWVNIGYQQRF